MPLKEFCDKLTKKHNAQILCEIYQGQSPVKLGPGVCRAVVAHWIAAHIQASATNTEQFAKGFREKAEGLKTGKTAESFLTHQKDFDFHEKAFEKARLIFKELKAEEIEWDKTFKKSGSQHDLAMLSVAAKKRNEAYEKGAEAAKTCQLYKTTFTAVPEKQPETTLKNLVTLLEYKLGTPGFYFISIGQNASKHALGFYTCHMVDTCVFIDPNTCEWVFSKTAVASSFLDDYFKGIKTYAGWLDEACGIDFINGSMNYEPLA